MIKDIKGIYIKGRNFLNGSDLLFWNDNKRYSFVYGRNGSGKTNISSAFHSLKNGADDFENVFLIYNEQANRDEEDKNKIYVFNDKYINEKISIREDGIGSIVMFGKQVSIDNRIEELKDKISEIEQNNSELEIKIKKYNADDSNHKDSIPNCKKKIEKYAKENWSENDKKIHSKGKSKFLKFEDGTISKLINDQRLKCDEKFPFDEYTNDDFNKNYNEYDKIKKETEKFADVEKLVSFIFTPSIDDRFEILSRKISTRSFTERENKIIEIIKNQEFPLERVKEYFSKDIICPFCFQTLSDKYKNDLLNEIDNILDEEVNNYKNDLGNICIEVVEIDKNFLNKLNSCLNYQIAEITELKTNLNNSINEFNSLVNKKKYNIYAEIDIGNIKDSLTINIEEYNREVAKINKLIEKYNEDVDKKGEKQKFLSEYNDVLLYKAVKDDFEILEKKESDCKKLQENLKNNIEDIRLYKNEILKLNSEKSNVKIAVEKINNMLSFVFFDNKRLVVEPNETGSYTIKSKGIDVKPAQISTGEKNILALCYFFTEYLKETNENDEQIEDKMLVIDDPVSSFDKENRLGVISLLKDQIDLFNRKTQNGKILILTHDLSVYAQLSKLYTKNACGWSNRTAFGHLNKTFELEKKIPMNEYRNLIKNTYDFVFNQQDDNFSIGNKTRKIFEEYFTLNYGVGLDEFIKNDDVIEKLPEKNRQYFKSFAAKLFLNNESHSEYKVNTLDDETVSYYSDDEKIRVCKSMLVLLYLLNDLHIIKIFENDSDYDKKITDIKEWVDECVL